MKILTKVSIQDVGKGGYPLTEKVIRLMESKAEEIALQVTIGEIISSLGNVDIEPEDVEYWYWHTAAEIAIDRIWDILEIPEGQRPPYMTIHVTLEEYPE